MEKIFKRIQTEDGSEFCVDPDELISRSKYFRAIFKYNHQPCVLIHGVSGAAMKQIISYGKEGKLLLNGNNIISLLEAADYLMLDDVLKEVRLSLPKVITPWNCINFFHAALNLIHLDIFQICYFYISKNFESVVKYADLGNLSLDHLIHFLKEPYLSVDSEDTVWKAVLKWIGKRPDERLSFTPQLLMCLRLEECTAECLLSIMNHPTIREIECVQGQLDCNITNLKEQFINTISCSALKSLSHGPRQRLFCSVSRREVHWSSKIQLSLVFDNGKIIAEIPGIKVTTHPLMFLRGEMFYVFSDLHPDFFGYNFLRYTWLIVRQPDKPYNCFTIVTVNDAIYTVCVDYSLHQIKIAVYDEQFNQWNLSQSFPILKVWRFASFTAIVNEGLIYVAGGEQHGESIRAYGAIYDPSSKTWNELLLPVTEHEYIIITSNKSLLLLIEQLERSVRRYYPEEGVWRPFQDLPFHYDLPHAQVRNGNLFFHEYFYENEQEARAIYWDHESGNWREGSALFNSPDRFDINDPVVVRKFHRQLMDSEWDKLCK